MLARQTNGCDLSRAVYLHAFVICHFLTAAPVAPLAPARPTTPYPGRRPDWPRNSVQDRTNVYDVGRQSAARSFVICHLSFLDRGRRRRLQPQRGQQLLILVDGRIGRGQELVAVEERVGAREKAKRLRLARESGTTSR